MKLKESLMRKYLAAGVAAVVLLHGPHLAVQAQSISRLAPATNPVTNDNPQGAPIVARFLPGQRFDLAATVNPGGAAVSGIEFRVDGAVVGSTSGGNVSVVDANGTSVAGDVVAFRRAYSTAVPGVHTFEVRAVLGGGASSASAVGTFEIVDINRVLGRRPRNVIILIGDGLGIAHRTAARLMLTGVSRGKVNGPLAMDTFPTTGLVITHSLNSIVTDSSPGAASYANGNKSDNNEHGVFPDDTFPAGYLPSRSVGAITDPAGGSLLFDGPRVESVGQYLKRTQGKSLGIVTTSDVFDATPAAFGTHTQTRAAGTGIVDQFFDERNLNGLSVLMGGGRKWFLPRQNAAGVSDPASARSIQSDYVLPADVTSAYGVPAGALDPNRDLISEFEGAGFRYAATKADLDAVAGGANKLLGLFALSNMNVALDKIAKRRGNKTDSGGNRVPGVSPTSNEFVVDEYGFPDQPMLDEMTDKAIQVLSKDRNGFVLMVEGASIDKQAHNMDTERWLLDTIEFDRAVGVARNFALRNGERDSDTLVLVTADHECAGVNIIGGLRADVPVGGANGLRDRADDGGGAARLRNGVVGTYETAGFPSYTILNDGYPETTDVDGKLLIGYAANADRYEDWLTNLRPLRDSQQPFNNQPPLNTYPNGPLAQDTAGNFLVTGQISDAVAAHTASDIPISALGRGSILFSGVQDNTDVFFRMMQALLGGVRNNVPGLSDDRTEGTQ